MGVGPGDADLAGLQRLADRIQRLRAELRQFVQEQHAVVRQRDLTRLHPHPTAGQGRHGRRVVGRAKRPVTGQGAAGDQAGDGMHHRGFQELLRSQGRQQAGQSLRQHRLARSRRPDVEQVVAAGGGDLQGALGVLLAFHLLQVGRAGGVEHRTRLWLAHHLRAAEVVDQGDQGARRQHRRLARPRRLGTVGFRADQAKAHGACGHRRRQGAGHRRDLAVEVQLSNRRPAVQDIRRQDAHQAHQRKGDRQVVVVAFLGQVGRREVGDDALGRQGQS